MQAIKTIGLVAKKHNDEAVALADEMSAWLSRRGVSVFLLDRDQAFSREEQSGWLGQADLVLVLGGDGTMINAIKLLAGKNIPIAGVNLGRVGFLLELSRDTWATALERAITHGFVSEERLMLRCELVRDGNVILSEMATNEAVIARSGIARLVGMDISVGGRPFLYLRADGIIFSTPTGSTAYASSAGGPLLYPALNAYSVTAVCPFMSRLQPLVLGGETDCSLTVREISAKTFLTLDGQHYIKLFDQDVVRLRGVPGAMRLAQFGLAGYLDKLRNGGIVRDSPGNNG